MGWGLGKLQKEGQRGDKAEEHQEVVGKGKEEGQTRESEKHSGEPVVRGQSRMLRKNLLTVTSGIGRDTHARLRESKPK